MQSAESVLELKAVGSRLPFPRGSKYPILEVYWVAVQELKLSYHDPETILFTIYPYYGNLH